VDLRDATLANYFKYLKVKRMDMAALNEGDPAPDFRLPADDGREIALADFRGRPVLLYFFPKALSSG